MAATLMSPQMVSTADGCSGAAPYGAGWMSLDYKSESALPVDGLIIFDGWLSEGTKDEDAISSVTVVVKDAAEVEVPGTLLLVDGRLMWRSSAVLSPDTTYNISWEVEPGWSFGKPPSGSTTFTTSSTSAHFAEATVYTPELTRQPFLVGEQTSCDGGSFSSCGPYTWTFGTTEWHAYGIRFDLGIPTAGPTYQRVTLERIPGKGSFFGDSAGSVVFAGTGPKLTQQLSAIFNEEMSEYCVRIVRRDLRNDTEATQDVCVPHHDIQWAGESLLEEQVGGCESPPDLESLLPMWCQTHSHDARCEDAPPYTPPNPANPDDPGRRGMGALLDEPSSDSGCACSVPGPTPGRGSAYALLALGAALALKRRRRKS